MTRKRHTEEQIIAVLKEAHAGIGVQELCRKHGISNEERTHSTIGDVTPQEFIANYQNGSHLIQELTSSALV